MATKAERITEGLNGFYSYLSCVLENHEDSILECTCEGCKVNGDCLCTPRKRCEGCKTTAEWEAALGWLSQAIDRRHKRAARSRARNSKGTR